MQGKCHCFHSKFGAIHLMIRSFFQGVSPKLQLLAYIASITRGVLVKFFLFICLLVIPFSLMAQDDDLLSKYCPENSQKNCQVVISPLEIPAHEVKCVGMLMSVYTCSVKYSVSGDKSAIVRLQCGKDPKEPVLNERLDSNILKFHVSKILTDEAGALSIDVDPNTYLSIMNPWVDILVTESGELKNYSVKILLQGESMELTDLACF